jgi:2-phosphosulfolactate phosphatase
MLDCSSKYVSLIPMHSVRALFSPAEFTALAQSDLRDSVCVVFDVLRATSTLTQALSVGARAVIPESEISEALVWKRRDPNVLLAGERDGIRIGADLTGGVEFDLGNSPREFTLEKVRGRVVVMTTTNGTRALRACRGARAVLAASLGNVSAVVRALDRWKSSRLILVASGTYEDVAYEDVLGIGALLARLEPELGPRHELDSARLARQIYDVARTDLLSAVTKYSRNGRRLIAKPDLAPDVEWCLREDTTDTVGLLNVHGWIEPLVAPDLPSVKLGPCNT